MINLKDLEKLAADFSGDIPENYHDDHYIRNTISKDKDLEIVVICFQEGQTSTVHDHKGSNCVIRVIKGVVLETLFKEDGRYHAAGTSFLLSMCSFRNLFVGDISGLNGEQVHQISNVFKGQTVLLNFYSPPLK